MTRSSSKRLLTEGVASSSFGFRPLRASCIGTSIYANGLRTANNVTVDVNTAGGWDYTKMDRYMQNPGGQSWFTWMCLMSGGRILHHYNGAESGSMLPSWVARFQQQVLSRRPDIVFLGDATNDINNAATDADIRSNVVALINMAVAAHVIPILTATIHRNDDTAKNTRVRQHNEWLRRYAWANGYHFIDPFAALVDPASTTANTLATMTRDGLHPNEIGAKAAGQRALDDMAGFLRGNSDPSKAKFVALNRAGSPNLIFNPLFQDDVNADGTADSWTVYGSPTSKTVVTDARVLGKMQQVVLSGGGQGVFQQLPVDTTNIAVGDRLAFGGLAEVSGAVAGNLQWSIGISSLSNPSPWTSMVIGYNGAGGGGPLAVDLPLSAFYCEYTVPTGATAIRCDLRSYTGTSGTFSAAQWRLINLTKLGLDGIY